MEKLSFELFDANKLPKTSINRFVGGTSTLGGSKVVNSGTDTSACVSWTSDEETLAGNTVGGYTRTTGDFCPQG